MSPRARALASPPVVLSLLALVTSLAVATETRAHGPSTSYSISTWRIEDGSPLAVRAVLRVAWADLQRSLPKLRGRPLDALAREPALAALVEDRLGSGVRLIAGEGECARDGPARLRPSPDLRHVVRTWRLACPRSGSLALQVDLLFDALPGHVHLARVEGGGEVQERTFVEGERTAEVSLRGDAGAAGIFAEYLRLGVTHILAGFDHLAFLAALLLLGATLRETAVLITGFTVAHSVTLALAALDLVQPGPAAVESLIGFSIAVVAVENFAATAEPRVGVEIATGLATLALGAALLAAFGQFAVPPAAALGLGLFSVCHLLLSGRAAHPARLRWFVAFVFGAVHGFGFAGVLVELGLPPSGVVASLLAFNLGVELGQLAAVAAAWPLLQVARRAFARRYATWVQIASTPILAAGLYWFIARGLPG